MSSSPTVDKCLNINCGIHGSCSDGLCTCKDTYTGDNCDISPVSTIIKVSIYGMPVIILLLAMCLIFAMFRVSSCKDE